MKRAKQRTRYSGRLIYPGSWDRPTTASQAARAREAVIARLAKTLTP